MYTVLSELFLKKYTDSFLCNALKVTYISYIIYITLSKLLYRQPYYVQYNNMTRLLFV